MEKRKKIGKLKRCKEKDKEKNIKEGRERQRREVEKHEKNRGKYELKEIM